MVVGVLACRRVPATKCVAFSRPHGVSPAFVGRHLSSVIAPYWNIDIAKSSFVVITESAKVHALSRPHRPVDPRSKPLGRVVSKNNNTDFPVIDIEHISKHYLVDGKAIPAITDINLRIE